MAIAGEVVNLLGCWAASAQPLITAMGFRWYFLTASSEARITAAAPSESGDALGAVTVPVLGMNAGLMLFSFSMFSGRSVFSSLSTMVSGLPRAPGMVMGAISTFVRKRPFSVADWAFRMVRMA